MACAIAMFIAGMGAPLAQTAKPAEESIGVARMRADGTIVLELRARGPGGTTGHGMLEYPPGHPRYREVLRHLGGMKPGEVKNVPPFPD
jgi:hypothetical protein